MKNTRCRDGMEPIDVVFVRLVFCGLAFHQYWESGLVLARLMGTGSRPRVK